MQDIAYFNNIVEIYYIRTKQENSLLKLALKLKFGPSIFLLVLR